MELCAYESHGIRLVFVFVGLVSGSNLSLSSWVKVVALLRRSFGILAQQFLVCLVNKL